MVMPVCKEFRMVDSEMLEVRNIQHIVGFPAVRKTMLSGMILRSMIGIIPICRKNH